jgi:hypothetical protein
MKDLTNSNRNHGLKTGTGKFKNPVLLPNFENLVTTSDFSVIYKTNSLGMRDKEYSVLPPQGVHRLIALGDSFTFGEGISYGKRFTDIAEDRLNRTEILNMGVPGYGVDQELEQFIEFGLPLKPEQVFLFINRVDTLRINPRLFQNGKLSLEETATEQTGPFVNADASALSVAPDLLKSQFLSFAIYNFRMWKLRSEFAKTDFREWGGLALDLKHDGSAVISETDSEVIKRTTSVIEKLLNVCIENHIRLAVVNIDPEYDLSYLKKVNGLDYVDLSGELAAAARKFPLRFTYDRHFNEKTNALLGDIVTGIINERLKIPVPKAQL